MAESNATQVILTDDGIKIIKAQNTADNAASGVNNLNDPNLMSVIEKQYNISQFAGLTSQYNVIIQNAKDDGIDTTALTTAYNDLNNFMANILKDPDHASDIDRSAYKKYQDTYNGELAKIQNSLQNSANNKFASAASAESQAAIATSQAFSQAQSAVDYANTAIANDKVTSQAVTALKGGSKLTIQQLQDGLATKIESSDFKSYQKQAADMFVSEVSFNSMTISNRNLALGTANAFKTTGNNTEDQGQVGYGFSKTIQKGTVVTVSFDVSSTTGVGSFTAQFYAPDSGASWQWIATDNLANGTKHVSKTFTADANQLHVFFRLDYATGDVTFSNFIISESSKEVSWTPAPEDTQSQFTQLADKINLRVTKDGLISQINLQAKNTLISSGGQLTLSGKNINFDTVNPVIIPSANIDTLLVNKTLTAANISANTFSTNNKTFTVESNGAITAKNMTLTGGTLTSPTINASTINGGTLNMQTDGLINSPYNGIVQTADQFYHPWKLNTGQLTIGQGYITSVSSGTRSINGVPKQFNSLQGTLSASYLKFTNDFGSRNYIDADMLTCSSPTNNGTMVAINATGNIGINAGDPGAPALTISSGHIDASSSSSYGVFGAITLGYNAHTINSDSSLFFESGHGSGNPGINIWAKGFQSLSSRLSTKRQVRLLDDEHSNGLLLGADTATFQYNQDTNADNSNEGVIIDDVNTVKKYNLPDELITRDGKAPTDLMSFIARIISQNKYQARLIENLQIRLRKVEIKNE
ncbi:phage tail protein [Lactiplantibacillus plantarum]|nr:phage tail protein [Lactiplantibacillus plantarum]MCG0863091.1 phage tail protein [Lactiplantibacillus plantarum]